MSQPAYLDWEKGDSEPSGQYYPALFKFLRLDENGAAVLLLRDRLARGHVPFDAVKEWERSIRAEKKRQGR